MHVWFCLFDLDLLIKKRPALRQQSQVVCVFKRATISFVSVTVIKSSLVKSFSQTRRQLLQILLRFYITIVWLKEKEKAIMNEH